mmetsp:Transcript_50915/g.133375  ORF Transcript_50915/g.133375 Transcript_50915/m.133375 type:complete len:324 (+) Transcript_50915:110-1081(+)
MWSANGLESIEYVRQLHSNASGHYGGNLEDCSASVVQSLRAILESSKELDCLSIGIEGIAFRLLEESQGPGKSEARRRCVSLDGTTFEEAESEADHPKGGVQRRHPPAGLPRRVHRAVVPVRQLPPRGGGQHVDRRRPSAAEGGPQAHLLPSGAAHPQAPRPHPDLQRQGGSRRPRLLLPQPPPRQQIPGVPPQRGPLPLQGHQRAGARGGPAQQQRHGQVLPLRRARAHLQGRPHLPAPPPARRHGGRRPPGALHGHHPVAPHHRPRYHEGRRPPRRRLFPHPGPHPPQPQAGDSVHGHRLRADGGDLRPLGPGGPDAGAVT